MVLREYILPHTIYPLHLLKWGHITPDYSKESWPKDNLEYSKFNFTTEYRLNQKRKGSPEHPRVYRHEFLQTRVLTDTSSYRHEFHYLVAIKETRLLVFNKVLSNTHTTRSQSQLCLSVYHPPWLATKERYAYTSLDWSSRSVREKYAYERHWIPLLGTKNSYLLGLRGPQPLDSYRLETRTD